MMTYLKSIPAFALALFLTGCGSDEIEISQEQSAAQQKVEALGGAWMGHSSVSINFSSSQMDLKEKSISDAELAVLAEVENLEMLDLAGSPISNTGLSNIADLTKVNTINLSGTQVTGEGIKAISALPLYQVIFKNCTDDVAIELAAIKTVKILHLDGEQLTNVGIAALADLPELRQLTISRSQLTNEGLATLGDLKKINTLDISNTAIDDEGLAVLGGLSSLNSVSLTGTQVTQDGVNKLQQLLPDTFIDFQNPEGLGNDQSLGAGAGQDSFGELAETSSANDTAQSRLSPLGNLARIFTGNAQSEISEVEETGAEAEEAGEQSGGTLGAIFRSLNPLD